MRPHSWWRVHQRTVTKEMLDALPTLADRVWDEVEGRKMKKKMEAQQNSLRNRIIWFLQQEPSTTAYLAKKLNATSKAVDSHLYRLRKEGIVVRQSWGLYAIAKSASPGNKSRSAAVSLSHDEQRPKIPVVSRPGKVAPADTCDLDDIYDGIDEPRGLRSLPCRGDLERDANEPGTARPRPMPTAAPRALPTAEPRW